MLAEGRLLWRSSLAEELLWWWKLEQELASRLRRCRLRLWWSVSSSLGEAVEEECYLGPHQLVLVIRESPQGVLDICDEGLSIRGNFSRFWARFGFYVDLRVLCVVYWYFFRGFNVLYSWYICQNFTWRPQLFSIFPRISTYDQISYVEYAQIVRSGCLAIIICSCLVPKWNIGLSLTLPIKVSLKSS